MNPIGIACVASLGALAMTAHGEEATKTTEDESAPNTGAWSTGMEAMSVGLPAAASSSTSSVNAPAAGAAEKAKRGQFLAVPIPRVDPALGNGLIGVAAYIFKLDRADMVSPPSVVGAFAMWMDGGSVGGGLGGKLYLKEDRFRVTGGGVYADLRYDLGGTSALTGNAFNVPISQVAHGGLASAQFRIAPGSYLGLSMKAGKLSTELRTDSPPNLPTSIEDEIGRVLQVNSLGPTYAYDTRDSAYYPRMESRSMPASTFTPIRSGAMLTSIVTK